MRNIYNKNKKNVMILLAAVQIIICICLLFAYKKEPKSYHFDSSSLVSNSIVIENFLDTQKTGYYIDSSEQEKVNFSATPKINLKLGSYKVIIHYQTDSYLQTYLITADNADFREWLGNYNNSLPQKKNVYTAEVSTLRNLNNFEVQFNYSGDGYFFISDVEIIENKNWVLGAFLFALLLFILLDYIILNFQFIKKAFENKKNKNIFVTLTAIIIFSSSLLFMPYLYYGHDLIFHLLRIEGIREGILSGQFPVKMQPNWLNGYGYGTSIFYGDFLLYFPAFLRIIGFSVQSSFQMFVFAINVLTALVSFYSFNRFFRSYQIGLLGCFLYTCSVYRLNCVYVRASVGEYCAMIFLPLFFVAVMELFSVAQDEKKKNSWILGMIGATGLVSTHIITSEIVGAFMIVVCLLQWKKTFQKDIFIELVKMVVGTIAFSLWFLVPFLDMSRGNYLFNSVEKKNGIQTSGIFLSQLLTIFPQGGKESLEYTVIDGIGTGEEFSFALGGGFIAAIFIFILFCINRKKAECNVIESDVKQGKNFLCIGIILVFMASIYFPWNDIFNSSRILGYLTSTIQFPWRLMTPIILFFSLLACVTVKVILIQNKYVGYASAIIITLFAAMSSSYLLSDRLNDNFTIVIKNADSLDTFGYMGGEYLPEGAEISRMDNKEIGIPDGMSIDGVERKYQKFQVICTNISATESYLDFPLLYYKGYDAKNIADKTILTVEKNQYGYVRVIIPKGYSGSFILNYTEPWYWRAAELISLLTLFFIVFQFRGKIIKIKSV